MSGSVTVPALCNYLQEVAGVHAAQLGVGIDQLQEAGITWMMSGLHLLFNTLPSWREEVKVTTWPSGCRGRLVTTRDFIVTDSADKEVLIGVSEWLMINRKTNRVTRLPPELQEWIDPDAPRAPVPASARLDEPARVDWHSGIVVQRTHIDLNNHANNVHYVTWLLEPLPDDFAARRIKSLDISYRAAAVQNDRLISEAERISDNQLLHRIQRPDDGQLITLARTTWES